MAMYAMNHIGGFITFIKPGLPSLRKLILPFHVFIGTACIVLAGGVAISGLTEKALFSL